MQHHISVIVAKSFWQRTIGLIGRRRLIDEEGMFFERCSSIHTMFMLMPIDVLFLDQYNRVVHVVENVKPWRPYVAWSSAESVLEMGAGAAQRLAISEGDTIVFG
jgi:uncharacterized membrane protein (UPF0127 family)